LTDTGALVVVVMEGRGRRGLLKDLHSRSSIDDESISLLSMAGSCEGAGNMEALLPPLAATA